MGVERWTLVYGLMAVSRSENRQSFAPHKCMAAFVANPGTVPSSVTLFKVLVRFEIVIALHAEKHSQQKRQKGYIGACLKKRFERDRQFHWPSDPLGEQTHVGCLGLPATKPHANCTVGRKAYTHPRRFAFSSRSSGLVGHAKRLDLIGLTGRAYVIHKTGWV